MREVANLDPASLDYQVLRECVFGPEELFVLTNLIHSGEPQELRRLLRTLVALVEGGLLVARLGSHSVQRISLDELSAWVEWRRVAGEAPNEPTRGEDYDFTTTELGIGRLREEDWPRGFVPAPG